MVDLKISAYAKEQEQKVGKQDTFEAKFIQLTHMFNDLKKDIYTQIWDVKLNSSNNFTSTKNSMVPTNPEDLTHSKT